jgi:hypothetical protein
VKLEDELVLVVDELVRVLAGLRRTVVDPVLDPRLDEPVDEGLRADRVARLVLVV